MTNAERITELQLQILNIRQDLVDCHPDNLSIEDIEDVSDNYQAHLEYGWYRDEQNDTITDITEEIKALELLSAIGTWAGELDTIEEIEWPIGI